MTTTLPRAVWKSQTLVGVVFAGVVAAIGFAVNAQWSTVSPLTSALVVAVVLGNTGLVPTQCDIGLAFSSRQLLRAGVVILGLQLSVSQIADLGPTGFLLVVGVVICTFLGTQGLARLLGIRGDLGLLTATGFSICGVSAVSAMVGATDANEDDATYAIALVTLFGSLSIVVLPILGRLANMTDAHFGVWAGSAVHDVAQVVATSTTFAHDSLGSAMVVKLTRVVLLAPLVSIVALARFRRAGRTGAADRPNGVRAMSPLPTFIVLFLAMVAIRSTGIVPDDVLSFSKNVERFLLAMALVGLGSNVRIRHMRVLGIRPIILGVASWILVMSLSFVTSNWIHLSI